MELAPASSFPHHWISALFILSLHLSRGVGGLERSGPFYDCYSCMSNSYFAIWDDLMASYYPPENYTDDCESPQNAKTPIKTHSCQGICMTIVEQNYAGGSRYMRGCVHRLLLFGFDEEWMQRQGFKRVDTCRVADRTRFLPMHSDKLRAPIHTEAKVKAHLGSPESPDAVTVCSCIGSKCNSYAVVVDSSTAPSPFPALLALIILSKLFI